MLLVDQYKWYIVSFMSNLLSQSPYCTNFGSPFSVLINVCLDLLIFFLIRCIHLVLSRFFFFSLINKLGSSTSKINLKTLIRSLLFLCKSRSNFFSKWFFSYIALLSYKGLISETHSQFCQNHNKILILFWFRSHRSCCFEVFSLDFLRPQATENQNHSNMKSHTSLRRLITLVSSIFHRSTNATSSTLITGIPIGPHFLLQGLHSWVLARSKERH